AASIECRECGLDERCQVSFLNRRESVEPRAYIHCSACGVVRIDMRRLLRWNIDASALAEQLAVALGAADSPTALVPGLLWRVGRKRIGSGNREILLLVRMLRSVRDAVAPQLARHPRAIVLVPTEMTASRLADWEKLEVVALEELVRMEAD